MAPKAHGKDSSSLLSGSFSGLGGHPSRPFLFVFSSIRVRLLPFFRDGFLISFTLRKGYLTKKYQQKCQCWHKKEGYETHI